MRVHLAINCIIMECCELKLSCGLTLVDSEERCKQQRTVAVRDELVPWRRRGSVHRLQVRVLWLSVCMLTVMACLIEIVAAANRPAHHSAL